MVVVCVAMCCKVFNLKKATVLYSEFGDKLISLARFELKRKLFLILYQSIHTFER